MASLMEIFIRRVSVEGSSMVPTYLPGERLTAVRRWRKVRVGDVVVVHDPANHERFLLKRCVAILGSQLDLRGDNADFSTDSRSFGLVPSCDVSWLIVGSRHK